MPSHAASHWTCHANTALVSPPPNCGRACSSSGENREGATRARRPALCIAVCPRTHPVHRPRCAPLPIAHSSARRSAFSGDHPRTNTSAPPRHNTNLVHLHGCLGRSGTTRVGTHTTVLMNTDTFSCPGQVHSTITGFIGIPICTQCLSQSLFRVLIRCDIL